MSPNRITQAVNELRTTVAALDSVDVPDAQRWFVAIALLALLGVRDVASAIESVDTGVDLLTETLERRS